MSDYDRYSTGRFPSSHSRLPDGQIVPLTLQLLCGVAVTLPVIYQQPPVPVLPPVNSTSTRDLTDSDDDDDDLEEEDGIFYTCFAPSEDIWASSTVSQWLAEAFAKNSAPPSNAVPKWVCDFEDVFSREAFNSLPEHQTWDHAIELVPNAKPANCKVYPISPVEQKELDAFIE